MTTIDERVADDYDPWAHWEEAGAQYDPPAPAAWPDRTHDGQRDRDTETADVAGEVL